jgi:hypothetical protein
MAAKTSWYATEPSIGYNFNQSYSSVVNVASSVTSSSTADINESQQNIASDLLGTVKRGTDNSEWILLKASTTVTQFMVVGYDDAYNANDYTTQIGLTGNQLALCQVQTYGGVTATSCDPGSNPVFWGMLKGTGAQVQVSGSAGTGVAVNNGTVPGMVSISTTGSALKGIVLLASAGASAAVECMVLYPHVGAFT